MKNVKIMVNFEEKKIIHTVAPVGSKEYEGLVKKGYVKVGVIKIPPELYLNLINLFWDNNYFDPQAKYQKPLN